MVNSHLKFRTEYFASTKLLTLTDLIGTPAGAGYNALLTGYNEDSTNIQGIFKAQSPAGVFYGGTAFNANDFSTPDVDGSTNDWSESGISLPLAGTDILCGTYTFGYKARLTLVDTFDGYDAGGYFKVTGTNDYSILLGATPTGLKLQIYNTNGVTTNEGVYDLTTVTFATTYTKFYVSNPPSTFTPDADDHIAIIFETSKTFKYCFERPTSDLDSSSSCIYSTLTAEDNSDYDYNFVGYGTKTPAVVRSWSVDCPADYSPTPITAGSVNPLTIGYGTSYNSGADLWTGIYTIELTSVLTYSVDTWGVGTYWVLVHDTIVTNKAHTVECDTCFCDIRQCVENLYTKYKTYVTTRPQRALELGGKLFNILNAWMLYGMAERCGTDYSTWCNEISQLVLSEDCQCETDTSVSKEVVPVSLQITGGGCNCGVTFGAGDSGFPSSPVEGNTHFFNADSSDGAYLTGDIYFYTGGAWVFQYNNVGATGATGSTGSTGSTGAAGADGVEVIFDNTLETPTTLSGATYAAFTGMTTAALTNLATLGDKYVVKASFETNDITKLSSDYVKLTIDGLDLYKTYISPASIIENPLSGGNNKYLDIVAEITVIDVANKKLMVKHDSTFLNHLGSYIGGYSYYSLITLSSALNNFIISALGKIGTTGTVGCRRLSVEFYNK